MTGDGTVVPRRHPWAEDPHPRRRPHRYGEERLDDLAEWVAVVDRGSRLLEPTAENVGSLRRVISWA